jgi:choline monooxygenase
MKHSTTDYGISMAVLESVSQPVADARGMPNAVYTDPSLFAFERDHVFGKTWAGLAFADELPRPGYAKPVEFMGLPLAILRDADGEIKVFHNVCSHRGLILLHEESEIHGMIRCRYHSWTYDLGGNLKATPNIGGVAKHSVEGFSCENHGLKIIRSAIWMGIIYINLSGKAEGFEQFIKPLEKRWEGFTGKGGVDQMVVATTGSDMNLTVKANWKLAVENYCEAYHLPWVHPGLNRYSPLDQHYNLIVSEYMSGQGTHAYNPAGIEGISLPNFADWPQDKTQEAEYVALYPNVLMGIQIDHVFSIILDPQAIDRTLEKFQISYIGEASGNEQYAACRKEVLDSWEVVFREDIFAVEGMQKGRSSPAYEGGVFSPVLDVASHHFHGWIANKYVESF